MDGSILAARLFWYTARRRLSMVLLLVQCLAWGLAVTIPTDTVHTSPPDVIRAYYNALNARDIDAIMATFDPNATLRFSSLSGQPTFVNGATDIRQYYATFYLVQNPATGNVYQIDYKPPAWLAYVTLTWGPDFPTVEARQYFLVAHGRIQTMTDLDTSCFC